MTDRACGHDPVEERTSSQVFLPFNASLVRKLEAVDHIRPESPVPSEPSDDSSERRYSDLSQSSDRIHSLDTIERIRQCKLRTLQQQHVHHSPVSALKRPSDPPLRSFTQTTSISSLGISSIGITPSSSSNSHVTSPSKMCEETILTPTPPPPPPPLDRFTPTSMTDCQPSSYQPRPSEYYNSRIESNPAFFSTPLFRQQNLPKKPQPIRPLPAPQNPPRRKMSSLWKIFSSKRTHKRQRTPHQPQHHVQYQPHQHHQPPSPQQQPQPQRTTSRIRTREEKRNWATSSFRLLRLSSRNHSNLDHTYQHYPPSSYHNPPPPSDSVRVRCNINRPRSTTRSLSSTITAEMQSVRNHQQQRAHVNDSPSLGTIPYSRERAHYDPAKEPHSFAGYRTRPMFAVDGSSISSSSDREEEHNLDSTHLYLTRRQMRAMQYK